LFVPLSQAAHAQEKPADLKQDFLRMFARAYYPGRSGQIMLVPQQGDVLTRTNAPLVSFMHGSPWDYDRNIPLLFFGPPFVRQGSYSRATIQQDIVPTLAALLKLPLPSTVSGRPLSEAVNPTAGRPRAILLIVLDGMRRDYFDRHSAVLPTLTRLRQEGAWFSNTRVISCPQSPLSAMPASARAPIRKYMGSCLTVSSTVSMPSPRTPTAAMRRIRL
jgi:hypothetical protein